MKRRTRLVAGVLAVLVAVPAAAADTRPSPPKTVEDCDALARDHPKDLSSYLCYWIVARNLKAWDAATRSLDARLALEPANHLAQLYLGLIEADRRHDARAKALFESAANGLEAEKNTTGAVYALLSLTKFHQFRSDMPHAGEYLIRAQRVAESSGDPMLLARIDFELARQAYLTADYSRAWTLISKAKDEITPQAPFDLRSGLLDTLGVICWELGRYRDSLDYYEKQAAMLHDSGNLYLEAQARYNVAMLSDNLRGEDGISRKEVGVLVRQAFDTAVSAGNEGMADETRLLMAQDPTLPDATRIAYLETVLQNRRTASQSCEALRLLALLRYRTDPAHPQAAFDLIDKSIGLAQESGNANNLAFGYAARMTLRSVTGPRQAAIADSLAALDQVEKIRDLQRDEMVRARWFNRQATYYYQASGYILDAPGGSPSPSDLDVAFNIAERMRARALLDTLDGARVTGGRSLTGPKAAERDAALRAMADGQRRLLEGPHTPAEKTAILDEIAKLESKEAVLRDEIGRSEPRLAALASPKIPSIDELRSLLPPDEVLLAFQLSTRRVDDEYSWSRGGSWVVVLTHESARAFPLPDADLLIKEIDLWVGTFARRDGLEKVAAGALYDDLLKDALDTLPAGIRRLVVVPDRELHRLPFDALSRGPSEAPLGARFEISIAPSATVWARWRQEHTAGVPQVALALADPKLPTGDDPAPLRQGAPWIDGVRLGPLPYARTEARRLSHLLGDRCRVLEGTSASERSLKRASPDDYGVLVLATHAVVDEQHPERSAVLLSPGSDDEDGLLQPREIVELPLAGRLVVLTSCASASGTLLRGEGVVGLARAFFQAGARAVVASLWPMRDDETAALAGDFYDHLSRGESVSGALAAARRTRMHAGAPAAEWAGLIVLGDGDAVPFPGGVARRSRPFVGGGLLLAAVATLALALIARFWRAGGA